MIKLFVLFLFAALQTLVAFAEIRFEGHTHREAQIEEKKRFVEMGGSTGVLLSYRYVLTAQHSCEVFGKVPDTEYRFDVVRVAEMFFDEDVCILEITWSASAGLPKNIVFPSKIWTRKDQVDLRETDSPTHLYHLGVMGKRFVTEKRRLSYSEGFAMVIGPIDDIHGRTGEFIYFNIGSEPGGSGGPVYRKSDNMLVSILSGPAFKELEAPKGTYKPEDSRAWLSGSLLYKVYKKSDLLKSIFPEGKNIYADFKGTPYTDEYGSLNSNGERDVLFTPLFSRSAGSFYYDKLPDEWNNEKERWLIVEPGITGYSLEYGNSCEGSEFLSGWRTPSPEEIMLAINEGISDPGKNRSFGGFIAQHSPLSFQVNLGEEIGCFENGRIKRHSEHNHKTPLANQCLRVCIKSEN